MFLSLCCCCYFFFMWSFCVCLVVSEAPHIRLPQHPSAAAAAQMGLQQALRSPTPAGAPLMLAPGVSRLPQPSLLNGAPPPLVSPTEAGLLYSPYDYPYTLAPALLEYPGLEHAAGTSYVRWTLGRKLVLCWGEVPFKNNARRDWNEYSTTRYHMTLNCFH